MNNQGWPNERCEACGLRAKLNMGAGANAPQGSTTKTPYGGSREPYVMLQFVIDFWENLPPVVIFSQVWWRVRALHAPCTHLARARDGPPN